MLDRHCDLLRSLHSPGAPLVVANAWDATSAKAVVAAGFSVVATTSGGVAATLGYEDHEAAPAVEMLAAAGRIAAAVDVPVTVDAEAGYRMSPGDLVDALLRIGAAGCNLEDTDHTTGRLMEASHHADWLAAVRNAASDRNYRLVINARIDVFLARPDASSQMELVEEAVGRARTYSEAGADCVFPILLHEAEAIAAFVRAGPVPVNILAVPPAPPITQLAELGVARISFGSMIYRRVMQAHASFLADLAKQGYGLKPPPSA